MKGGRILTYTLLLIAALWFAVPFIEGGWRVTAQGRQEADGQNDGLIYGDNPNRREPREGDPVLEARFFPDTVMIGDTFRLNIDVTRDIVQVVGLPEFEDGMIGDFFEIVTEHPEDTLSLEGRRIRLRKSYTLQTFEDGILSIGWFPAIYLDKNIRDTIWSVDSLVLYVNTFEIDTLNQTIHDIRGIRRAPVKFGEFGGYTLGGLLLLALIAVAVWYYIARRRNLTMLGRPKVVDPPHVAAIKALEVLHNQKLWQNNRHKQYYTGITDILREYLEQRYCVSAMEMTSDEILDSLQGFEVPGKIYGDLTEILRTADLVKFAKYVPDPETNETVYTQAYYFVEETKPFEIEKPETEEGSI
ncbi:MAG: hypothetical protein LUF87_00070 [Alistipes sp.]|nr:hypothetical protein [Alistipes sp.]